MDDHLEKVSRVTLIHDLTYHDKLYMHPLPPHLSDVGHRLWTVIVCGSDEAAKVLEWDSVVQGLEIVPKGCLRSSLSYLCGYPVPLSFRSPGAQIYYGMSGIQISSLYKHISVGASGIGVVALV